MQELRTLRKHLHSWAKKLDPPPPESLYLFIESFLKTTETLVLAHAQPSIPPSSAITQESFRKLEREVDALENQISLLRKTMPEKFALYLSQQKSSNVNLRVRPPLLEKSDKVLATFPPKQLDHIQAVSKEVSTLFEEINARLPVALDKAEMNLAAMKDIKVTATAAFESGGGGGNLEAVVLPDYVQEAKALNDALVENHRKRLRL